MKKIIYTGLLFVLLLQTSCTKKSDVCLTCYNVNIRTGNKTDLRNGCGKTELEATKAAFIQVPYDSTAVIQCNKQ